MKRGFENSMHFVKIPKLLQPDCNGKSVKWYQKPNYDGKSVKGHKIKLLLNALKDKVEFSVIKQILPDVSDINATDGHLSRTPLHYAIAWHCEMSVIDKLLSTGANVNVRDSFDITPLHLAATSKDAELMRKLLAHGADVNARNSSGDTALYIAVCQFKSLDVMKLLLKYGADVTLIYDDVLTSFGYFTVLDKAVVLRAIPCAKLLIKFILVNNFVKDFQKVVDLKSDSKIISDQELSQFLKMCIQEIVNLKNSKISGSSLFDFAVLKKDENIKPLYSAIEMNDEEIKKNFSNYYDFIMPNISLALQRGKCINCLHEMKIWSPSNKSTDNSVEKEVILNFDCVEKICSYLSNDELINFTKSLLSSSSEVYIY